MCNPRSPQEIMEEREMLPPSFCCVSKGNKPKVSSHAQPLHVSHPCDGSSITVPVPTGEPRTIWSVLPQDSPAACRSRRLFRQQEPRSSGLSFPTYPQGQRLPPQSKAPWTSAEDASGKKKRREPSCPFLSPVSCCLAHVRDS